MIYLPAGQSKVGIQFKWASSPVYGKLGLFCLFGFFGGPFPAFKSDLFGA